MIHVMYEIVSDPEALAWFVMQSIIQEREYSEAMHLPKDVPNIQSVTDVGQSFPQCVQGR
jgi:hypothetical protein